MKSILRTFTVAAALAGAAAAPAQAQAWRDSLTARINAAYPQSKMANDWMRITQIGPVMVLQKDGIASKPGSGGLVMYNHYANGAIAQPRGFMAFMSGQDNMRQLKTGDKVYLVGTAVRDGWVMLNLATTETSPVTVNGNTQQTRYLTTVQIDFPRGYLATAPADSVLAKVGEIIKTEAAASAPASIALGQTTAEVEAALGRPNSVINLGPKVIYVYTSMKVIFQDGKVADVQ
jgi:hypothetical protein